MVSAGVGNVLNATKRHVGRNEVRVASDERRPLLILRHGDWAAAQALDRLVSVIALALEDACKCVVGLLDFADNNRLELAAGSFKVEVSLVTSVNIYAS